jgi:hypothetical protein
LAAGLPGDRSAAQDHLSSVRKRSCYRALRACLKIAAGLSIVSGFSAEGVFAFHRASQLQWTPFIISVIAVAALIWTFIIVAAYQAAILFVDIADLLIQMNRRQHDAPREA